MKQVPISSDLYLSSQFCRTGHVTKSVWSFMEVFQIELLFTVLPVLYLHMSLWLM